MKNTNKVLMVAEKVQIKKEYFEKLKQITAEKQQFSPENYAMLYTKYSFFPQGFYAKQEF